MRRRRYRRRSIAFSNSLDAFSAATFSSLSSHYLSHPLGCLVTLSRTCRHGGDEQRDHSGIELIVLGQNPTRLSELAKLKRVDLPDGYARREQGTEDSALVAAARLDADGRDAQATQALYQFGPACRVVADPEALALGQQHHVQAVARHVDPTMRKVRHLRIPSLLMRARALATVRVWKKRLEHQAHSRSGHQEGNGLPVTTGVVR